MCTVKPFYKHYFSRIDKWDDKIANNFLELAEEEMRMLVIIT